MELIGIAILLGFALAFSAIPFCTFNRDAKRIAGTSLLTNALLYRKLVDENKLTRMQISALEQQKRRNQANAIAERSRRWEASQEMLRIRLERARRMS